MRATVVPHIEGSRYYLVHGGTRPAFRFPPRWSGDRLLYPVPDDAGGLVVRTATFDGPVEVSVETFHPGAEVPVARGVWDLDEQVTLTATGRDVHVVTTFGEIEDLPVFAVAPGERFGVRIYARGIDEAREVHQIEIDEEPVEEHLLHIFRAR
ncbi:hypothetical protein EV383_3676 [Pseudonocardia sediminis]|uniref:Uncharacterized protein n=1 Tax=Pseudonocardia sediminis TaxID=1397368 RepID=A0A4Q7V057_PSEST|nr:hypothetical protein [Pseudonocardia sediminis]RZT86778.1 hypothetical protein EV383_3676 [Pseudonocardia sediminis]